VVTVDTGVALRLSSLSGLPRAITGQFNIMPQLTFPPRRLEDVGLAEVLARVAYRLVQIEARKFYSPETSHPPTLILQLAERLRREHVGTMYFPLVSLAKFVEQGGDCASWKTQYPRIRADRAPHKVRLLRGPRR
jgi:hypothetical protein